MSSDGKLWQNYSKINYVVCWQELVKELVRVLMWLKNHKIFGHCLEQEKQAGLQVSRQTLIWLHYDRKVSV